MAPCTVCTSEVQMSALVVLMIASVGPGVGIGLSANPTLPIPFITKARMALLLPAKIVRWIQVQAWARIGSAAQIAAQDARHGGSFLPPAMLRRRERRAASGFCAAPSRLRAGCEKLPSALPPACIGDCQCRAADRGAIIFDRSNATSISAANQQVTITAALV